jgi:Flp pilus assembly protein TadD
MRELQPPDTHLISAAAGWLELGLPEEARRELDRLSPEARPHPEVLAVEWDLHARAGRWQEALEIATQLLEADRARPAGWINRSYALHELRRTAEARDALLPALPLFPAVGVIPYNLACYACQLGKLEEARSWLRKAMELDGRDTVVSRARRDSDLTPLLPELNHL